MSHQRLAAVGSLAMAAVAVVGGLSGWQAGTVWAYLMLAVGFQFGYMMLRFLGRWRPRRDEDGSWGRHMETSWAQFRFLTWIMIVAAGALLVWSVIAMLLSV